MTIALHPSERAALRRIRRPARRRAWRQAAIIAAPIVGVITMLVLGAMLLLGRGNTAPAAARAAWALTTSVDPSALASPGGGTTGTAPLPPLPADLRALGGAASPGVMPAAPFSLQGASALDRARALECLAAAIHYEAASEPDDGQRAVAQVVLNRVRHPAFPATVCGVVYQGAERASGCQFSFACDGATARVPSASSWARAARTAAAALAGAVFAPVGLATHYHTYAVTPGWNRSLVMTHVAGAHFFHRWKGAWGMPAAFRQRYAGGEPPPRAADPVIAVARAVAVAPAVLPTAANVTPTGGLSPRLLESGSALSTPLGPDDAARSQILDRWKDSGKPLR